jgi:iron complex outermembrane receptor protein
MAESTGYLEEVNQERLAIFGAYHWTSDNKNWQSNGNVRQEWVDGDAVPFIFSLGVAHTFIPHWEWSANVSRTYRIPTFNDLYWEQGGNPDLMDEQGWSESFSIQYQRNFSKNIIEGSLTFYNKNVDNWIIWLPSGGFYSPQNLLNVWSRGLEYNGSWKWQKGDWSGQLSAQYNLTYSTNQKGKTANDASIDKQLIYVPLHQGRLAGQLHYKTWSFTSIHTIQGKTYTLADNTEHLPSFYLSHFHLSKSISLFKLKTAFFFKLNNIWDKNYQVIVSYPMPGRHFELGWKVYFEDY